MFYNHSVIGRLKDGMTREQATRDTAALASRVTENYPSELRIAASSSRSRPRRSWTRSPEQVRRPLLMLLGAVFLVLLVACANVANLFLCRAVAREREMGVRAAIGAGRHRLLQLLLAESLLLAVAGGALGLAIARLVLDAIPAVLTTRLPGVSGRRAGRPRRGLRGRAVGRHGALLRAGAARRGPPRAGRSRCAKARASVGGRRQGRVQAGLVVASVTLAFVLLVGAGLLGRSFARQMNAESGIHAPNVLSLGSRCRPPGTTGPRDPLLLSDGRRGLRAIPGVRAAAIASDLPLRPTASGGRSRPRSADPSAARNRPSPSPGSHGDYFSSFGIPIVRGAASRRRAGENRSAVIVNQTVADRIWPGEDPIGKRIKWGIPAAHAPWHTVVGVVGDVVEGPLGSEPPPHAYVPYTDLPDGALGGPTAAWCAE